MFPIRLATEKTWMDKETLAQEMCHRTFILEAFSLEA